MYIIMCNFLLDLVFAKCSIHVRTLYVCMYVCMYVYTCMYVRMYVHTYVRMYVFGSKAHLFCYIHPGWSKLFCIM